MLPLSRIENRVSRRDVPVAQGWVTRSVEATMLELPVLVGGTPLESHSGEFELHLFLQGRPIATMKAHSLLKADLAQTVEVPEVQIGATNAQGRTNRSLSSICANQHREIQIAVTLQPAVAVPGSATPVRIELNAGRTTIRSAERPFPLAAASST